jgi:hypothetical protein
MKMMNPGALAAYLRYAGPQFFRALVASSTEAQPKELTPKERMHRKVRNTMASRSRRVNRMRGN